MPGVDDPRFIAVQCVEAVLQDAARGFDPEAGGWRPGPALLSRSRSFDRRRADVSRGRRARVDLTRALRKLTRDRLADFESAGDLGDWLRLRKAVAPGIVVRVGFQKIHHWGLGKAFTLTTGVEAFADRLPEPIVSDDNLFRLLGRDEELCWTYVTAEDLQGCLDEAAGLIRTFLPRLEAASTRRLATLPARLPADIETRGPLDAAGGLRLARARASATAAEARLIIVRSGTNLALRDRHGFGPGLTVEGRLEPHGSWSYLFAAPGRRDVRVTVPSVGALTTTVGETPATFTFQPLEDAWVDSGQALALAEAHGGRDRRARAARTVDIQYSLEHDPARYGIGRLCQVHYTLIGPARTGRMDFVLRIDAATGEVREWGPGVQ